MSIKASDAGDVGNSTGTWIDAVRASLDITTITNTEQDTVFLLMVVAPDFSLLFRRGDRGHA